LAGRRAGTGGAGGTGSRRDRKRRGRSGRRPSRMGPRPTGPEGPAGFRAGRPWGRPYTNGNALARAHLFVNGCCGIRGGWLAACRSPDRENQADRAFLHVGAARVQYRGRRRYRNDPALPDLRYRTPGGDYREPGM